VVVLLAACDEGCTGQLLSTLNVTLRQLAEFNASATALLPWARMRRANTTAHRLRVRAARVCLSVCQLSWHEHTARFSVVWSFMLPMFLFIRVMQQMTESVAFIKLSVLFFFKLSYIYLFILFYYEIIHKVHNKNKRKK